MGKELVLQKYLCSLNLFILLVVMFRESILDRGVEVQVFHIQTEIDFFFSKRLSKLFFDWNLT